jgi:hypothetical protein
MLRQIGANGAEAKNRNARVHTLKMVCNEKGTATKKNFKSGSRNEKGTATKKKLQIRISQRKGNCNEKKLQIRISQRKGNCNEKVFKSELATKRLRGKPQRKDLIAR